MYLFTNQHDRVIYTYFFCSKQLLACHSRVIGATGMPQTSSYLALQWCYNDESCNSVLSSSRATQWCKDRGVWAVTNRKTCGDRSFQIPHANPSAQIDCPNLTDHIASSDSDGKYNIANSGSTNTRFPPLESPHR